MRVLLPALLGGALLLLAAAAVAATPRQELSAEGNRIAEASLLKQPDLGSGWSGARATSSSGLRFGCTGFRPKQKDIVEIGVATSPSFGPRAGGRPEGPFIAQTTSVYATPVQAAALWNRAVKPSLASCVARDLVMAARGARISIVSSTMLPFPRIAPRSAHYRVIGTVSLGSGKRLRVYLDAILLSRRRTISAIVVRQYQTIPNAKLERKLAATVARRLGS